MIAHALVNIAHAIDTRLDESWDMIDKLERQIMALKRNMQSQVNSRVLARQMQITETMEIFNECVQAVHAEVAARKQGKRSQYTQSPLMQATPMHVQLMR